jgi:hypothetical protein
MIYHQAVSSDPVSLETLLTRFQKSPNGKDEAGKDKPQVFGIAKPDPFELPPAAEVLVFHFLTGFPLQFE